MIAFLKYLLSPIPILGLAIAGLFAAWAGPLLMTQGGLVLAIVIVFPACLAIGYITARADAWWAAQRGV